VPLCVTWTWPFPTIAANNFFFPDDEDEERKRIIHHLIDHTLTLKTEDHIRHRKRKETIENARLDGNESIGRSSGSSGSL
jgi:hypothetical protein